MKKLFVSIPMNGKDNIEVKKGLDACHKSSQSIVKEDLELIDSWLPEKPDESNHIWYLAKSLELLSTADYVYFAEGWRDFRGCRIEHLCAEEYGMQIIKD